MRSHPDFFQGKTASFNHRGKRPQSIGDRYIYSDYSGSGPLEVYFDKSAEPDISISQDHLSRNIYDKQSVRPVTQSPINIQKNLTISFLDEDEDELDLNRQTSDFPEKLKVDKQEPEPGSPGSSPSQIPNEGEKDASGLMSLTSKNFKLNKINRYNSGAGSAAQSIVSSNASAHRLSSLKLGRPSVAAFMGLTPKATLKPRMNFSSIIAQARKLGLLKRKFALEKYIGKTQFNIIKDMSTGKFERAEEKRIEQLEKLKEKVLFSSKTKSKHNPHHKRRSTLKWARDTIPSLKAAYKNFLAFFKPVIMPNGKWRMFWDVYIMILIFYDLLLVPLQISFDLNSTTAMVYLELFFTICFLFDICLNFDTGYYEKGLLVMDRKKIAWHYIRSWFLVDAVSSFPYTYVFDNFGADDDTYNNSGFQTGQVLKLLKLLRIIRVLRVLKLRMIFTKLESYIDFSPAVASITGFFKISFIVLIIAHWLACIWHFVGTLELLEDPDNWIMKNNMVDYYWTKRYIASLYWAVTTMITVGYGDITPTTSSERVLAIVTMLIASVVFAYTMNRINHILTGLDNTSEQYKKALSMITDYMKKKHVKKELQIKIKKYLEYALSVDTSLDSNEAVLNTYLNNSLKDELISEIYGKILIASPVFKRFANHFMAKASLIMREKIYSPEDTIFLEYKYKDTNVYFIASGKVEIFHFFSSSYLKTLSKDESFGEVSFFTGKPHSISARSVDFSSIYYIKREEFLVLLDEFPSEKEKFYEVKDKIKIYKDFTFLGAKCFACDGKDHLVTSCPTVHLVIDKPKFIDAYIQKRNNFMSNYLRTGKRWTNDVERYSDMYIAARKMQRKINEGGYRHSKARIVLTMPDMLEQTPSPQGGRRTSLMVHSFRDNLGKRRGSKVEMTDNQIAKSAVLTPPNNPNNEEENQIQIHCEIPNSFMPQHLSLIFTPRKDEEEKNKPVTQENPWENDIDTIENYMFYFPHNNFNAMHPLALYQPKTTMFEYPTGSQATTKSTLKKFLNIMRRRMDKNRDEVLSKTLSLKTPDTAFTAEYTYNQSYHRKQSQTQNVKHRHRRSRFYRDRQESIFLTTGPLGDPDASADDEYENEM